MPSISILAVLPFYSEFALSSHCAEKRVCAVQIDADQQALDSIWQWNPPGELGESGAWQVVKELAGIYHK